jgi:hypothetical protein
MPRNSDTDDPLANAALDVVETSDQAVNRVSSSLGVQEPPGRDAARDFAQRSVVTLAQYSPMSLMQRMGGPDMSQMMPGMSGGGLQGTRLPGVGQLGSLLPSQLAGSGMFGLPRPGDLLPGADRQGMDVPPESLVPKTSARSRQETGMDSSGGASGRSATRSR